MTKKSILPFWETFIKIEVLVKIIKSKWLYIDIIIVILAVNGFMRYRKFVYIPDQDSNYRIENYSLGEDGEQPFYQSETDYQFVQNSEKLVKNKIMKFIAGSYYRIYKKNYKGGILYTQNIKISEEQFPEIYWMVVDACEIIGFDDIPMVFIGNQNSSSMVLTSYHNPKIIIGADYLWAYKPEELRYLIARELVHIKCNHTYLLDLVKGFSAIAESWVPDAFAEFIFGNMGIEFMNWYKEAQITADRGALAVTGDHEVAISALIKSNIGANYEDLYGNANPHELIKQLDKIQSESKLSKFAIMAEFRNPTPFIILRVKNLLEFYEENKLIFK